MHKEVVLVFVAKSQRTEKFDVLFGKGVVAVIISVRSQCGRTTIHNKQTGSLGARIVEEVQKHGLVVAHKTDHIALRLQLKNGVDDVLGVPTAIDVVAKKDDRRLGR